MKVSRVQNQQSDSGKARDSAQPGPRAEGRAAWSSSGQCHSQRNSLIHVGIFSCMLKCRLMLGQVHHPGESQLVPVIYAPALGACL